MDIIAITDLKISTTIGVYAWEKKIKQRLLISLDMSCDISKAAASDDVRDALNYAEIVTAIEQFTEKNTFQLIETLAEKLDAMIKQQFNVEWLRLKIAKPGAIANAQQVAVIIER